MSSKNSFLSKYNLNNDLFVFVLIIFLVSLYFFNFFTALIGFFNGDVEFPKPSVISLLSLFVFFLISSISLQHKKYYILLLPFVLLAFPSTVDNFFPSIYWGDKYEFNASLFPIITHIDVYLIMGLLFYGSYQKKTIKNKYKNILLVFILILLIYFLTVITSSSTIKELTLFSIGNFQLRYLLLFLLMLFYIPDLFNNRLITQGLLISVLFLFAEAISYTKVQGLQRLTSGSLGNNVFANIIAAVTIFFIFIGERGLSYSFRLFRYMVIAAGIIVVVFSETRMAVVSLVIIPLLYLIRGRNLRQLALTLLVLTVTIIFAAQSSRLQSIFDVLMAYIQPSSVAMHNKAALSTLKTRLVLNSASVNMFFTNPLIGVGVGRWNFQKQKYGVPFNLLLDPHNGFLSFLSQYGLIGFTLIFFYYLLPAYFFLRKRDFKFNLIPLSLSVTAFTNDNLYKHQVFALITFIIIYTIKDFSDRLRHKKNVQPA